jgi:hypothetical protein
MPDRAATAREPAPTVVSILLVDDHTDLSEGLTSGGSAWTGFDNIRLNARYLVGHREQANFDLSRCVR